MGALEEDWEGDWAYVPHGAVVVFPTSVVYDLFKNTHATPASVRNYLKPHISHAVTGWLVEEITRAIDAYDPKRAWPRTAGSRTRMKNKETEK